MNTMTLRDFKNHLIVFVLAALIGLATMLTLTPRASAFPLEGHPEAHCQVDTGLWLFHGSRRTICDSPRRADGSWTRLREFWTPAHQVPLSCSGYGSGNYYNSSCSGGYWQPETHGDVEDYPVNDGNVLPDEPPFIST